MNSNMNDYGVCWCGRRIESKVEDMRMYVAFRKVVVDSVPYGACEPCNYKYYKASIVEMLESLFRGEGAGDDRGK
jgi:hypothetical protein